MSNKKIDDRVPILRKDPSLVKRFAGQYGINPGKLLITLKRTAFRAAGGEIADEEMMALLVVAEQHRLNPFTREIYAFFDRNRGIVPVVGVDGWTRIALEHPKMDSMRFRTCDSIVESTEHRPCPEWIECEIRQRDFAHSIAVTEFLDECYRPPFKVIGGKPINGPWQTHTKSMLRHKAMIQCARVAFCFSGIYDPDEADGIAAATVYEAEVVQSDADALNRELKLIAEEQETVDELPAAAVKKPESRLYMTDQLE